MVFFDQERIRHRDFDQFSEIKIVGQINDDIGLYLCSCCFKLVDISEADFIEEDKEVRLDYITPDGCPIYGTKTRIQHLDYLEMFLRDITTEKIILPPNIKRRHMNIIKDKCSIKEIVVEDNCELFSMKDGNVYNKKGTTLVFSNK